LRFHNFEEPNMNVDRSKLARFVAAAVLGSALCAAAAPASTQPFGEGGRGPGARASQLGETDRAQLRERIQARMSQRLDKLAARLEIKASQQEAWAQFRKTVESLGRGRPQRPARDADAATLMRFRADMAQRMAQNLATVADATAQLQQALDPDQRKVLDEVARNLGRRGGHHRGHHGGWRGRVGA
jgi:hypothetical protein